MPTIDNIIKGLNMDGLLPDNKNDQELARQIISNVLARENKEMPIIDKKLQELMEKYEKSIIDGTYTGGNYNCVIHAFIKDLQSLAKESECVECGLIGKDACSTHGIVEDNYIDKKLGEMIKKIEKDYYWDEERDEKTYPLNKLIPMLQSLAKESECVEIHRKDGWYQTIKPVRYTCGKCGFDIVSLQNYIPHFCGGCGIKIKRLTEIE